MGLEPALSEGTAVRTAGTVSRAPRPGCCSRHIARHPRGWTVSQLRGSGQERTSPWSDGARGVTCVFSTQHGSQGCPAWWQRPPGIGVVPWPGGRQEWRKWRALFYLGGGEGAKSETRESLADLKGKDEFPWVKMSPQISPGTVSL